jgi:hypothetical protein
MSGCSILLAMLSYSVAICRNEAMWCASFKLAAARRHFAASSRKWAASAEMLAMPIH